MEKRISYSQFQQIKAAAKMIDPNIRKIEALKKKIMPLVEEMKSYQAINDSLEEGIVKIIGFHVYDLVKKVIEPTGSIGKDGKPVKSTKYLPTDIVSYDEQKKEYIIHVADASDANAQADTVKEQETIVPPTTADGPGSDFDLDKKIIEAQEEAANEDAGVEMPF